MNWARLYCTIRHFRLQGNFQKVEDGRVPLIQQQSHTIIHVLEGIYMNATSAA